MTPCFYYYHGKKKRGMVLTYLTLIILGSVGYLMVTTYINSYSTLVSYRFNSMFNDLLRKPFGPVGFYAFGILISIHYYEFVLAISHRELRSNCAYRLMNYVAKNKKRIATT